MILKFRLLVKNFWPYFEICVINLNFKPFLNFKKKQNMGVSLAGEAAS